MWNSCIIKHCRWNEFIVGSVCLFEFFNLSTFIWFKIEIIFYNYFVYSQISVLLIFEFIDKYFLVFIFLLFKLVVLYLSICQAPFTLNFVKNSEGKSIKYIVHMLVCFFLFWDNWLIDFLGRGYDTPYLYLAINNNSLIFASKYYIN